MVQITELTGDYRQRHIIPIEGSDTRAFLTLEFKTNLNCWFYSITWGEFSIKNHQIVTGANILRQYKNRVPFGIMVATNNVLDPLTLECWVDGTAELYVLNTEDTAYVEEYYGYQ